MCVIVTIARAAELYCPREIVCAEYFSFIDGPVEIYNTVRAHTVITIYFVLPTTISPNRQLPRPRPTPSPRSYTIRRFLVVAVKYNIRSTLL